jgi:3-oxoacyl-[acyl-carrier protein] reductase
MNGLSLEGKIAMVTGAKRGIGRAIALAFAKAGASVALCTRDTGDGRLQIVADEIRGLGRAALALQADVSRPDDVNRMVRQVVAEFGGIDLLVNNAAASLAAPLMETAEADWDRLMAVDLKGYFLCAQACARVMMERKTGGIINISSRLGISASPRMGAYSVAKAGELALTRGLALELAPLNIRVNAIAPGLVETEGSAHLWGQPEVRKRFESAIPLGRIAQPEDIARAALFLASEASGYITGHTMIVDGGSEAQ